ncbi:MAG: tRNA (adenosine(37)-N6)-dimethylallyltransferase MiaA [Actinomycetota bacterium]
MSPTPSGAVEHLALVAPTASGKTDLAILAARTLPDLEIVSVDSMQVYRGMDIGTAKVDRSTRDEIPHHLIDVVDPWDAWSVQRFQAEARAAVADIEARGRRALLVGGTGLYVQAVIDDLRFPGEDLALRAEIEARTAEPGGVAAAYARLEALDPPAAARVDPHNVRRIVRALEVIERTGERFSSFGPGLDRYGPTAFPVRIAGLWLPREVANVRIAERFAGMRAGGLVAEVERLRADPRGWSRTARQAIGYKELEDALDAPAPEREAALDAAFETAVRRTRSFARRQRMWFRRDPRITWFGAAREIGDVAPTLLAWWGAS